MKNSVFVKPLRSKGCACGHPVKLHADPDRDMWRGCLLCLCSVQPVRLPLPGGFLRSVEVVVR